MGRCEVVCYAQQTMSPLNAPLRIEPRESPRVLGACALMHAGFGVLVVTGWPWSLPLAVCLTLIAGSAWATVRELTALPREFVAILLTSDHAWIATDAQGNRHSAQQVGAAVVTAEVVAVPLRVGTRRLLWIAAADTTPPDLLRRLRVRLRCESSKPATAF
jgi:hypothetical protein